MSEAEWDAMVTVGLRSGFLLGQAAGRHMQDRNIKGRMIFITSLHAWSPRNLPHYSATKAGQTMVVKELARALGPAGLRAHDPAEGVIRHVTPPPGSSCTARCHRRPRRSCR